MKFATEPATPTRGMQAGGVPERRRDDGGALRVLLVDDCSANRTLVTGMLARWGIVPTVACDGAQAVQIAEQQDFDIVLMDFVMPVMDGVAATAKIRQGEREYPARPPVPIVAYTSMDLGANPALRGQIGVTAFLDKPCSPTTLHSCLALHCPDRFFAST